MNRQQLQTARTALWRQNASPLVTFEDAVGWLEETGFCLFLPRHAQLPAPAPSFVEACGGQARAMPAGALVEQAFALAARLTGEGRALPLNLLGTFSEQPDFLVTPEVLPWVASVRGDRNWKLAPGGRTSPIVSRTWEALEREPDRTAAQIRETLGRELTEAAVLRALIELWSTLRAVPSYVPGEPTRWNLLKHQWASELAAGGNTAQTTALSAMVSLYLRSAVAATAEETEVFLSPLTARSRIREVVHGMTAARHLGTIALGTETLLYLEGSLPEFAEAEEESAEAGKAAALPRPREPRGERRLQPRARPGGERKPPYKREHKPEHQPDREPERREPLEKAPEEVRSAKPRGETAPARAGERRAPPFADRQRRVFRGERKGKPPSRFGKGPRERRPAGGDRTPRQGQRWNAGPGKQPPRPWQKRQEGLSGPKSGARLGSRPDARPGDGETGEKREGSWKLRTPRPEGGQGEKRFPRRQRPAGGFGARPGFQRGGPPRRPGPGRSPARFEDRRGGPDRPERAERPPREGRENRNAGRETGPEQRPRREGRQEERPRSPGTGRPGFRRPGFAPRGMKTRAPESRERKEREPAEGRPRRPDSDQRGPDTRGRETRRPDRGGPKKFGGRPGFAAKKAGKKQDWRPEGRAERSGRPERRPGAGPGRSQGGGSDRGTGRGRGFPSRGGNRGGKPFGKRNSKPGRQNPRNNTREPENPA